MQEVSKQENKMIFFSILSVSFIWDTAYSSISLGCSILRCFWIKKTSEGDSSLSTCRHWPKVLLVQMVELHGEHRNQPGDAHGSTRPRYVLHFRHVSISSEAYILQKWAELGRRLFTRAHTCVGAGTPLPWSPGVHIAGGRICPSAFK